jgi:curved DNA-binding protein CbpA
MDANNFKQKTDLYKVLGVLPTASEREIKAAYKTLAMIYHPDKNKEASAHQIFVRIKEAYDILKDKVKKELYDGGLSESNHISEVFRAEKHSREFFADRLSQKEKMVNDPDHLRKRSKIPIVRVYTRRDEKDPEYNRTFDLDSKFFILDFSWSDPKLIFIEETLAFLFSQFGEINECIIDQSAQRGYVEYKRIEDCEKSMSYFQECQGTLKVGFTAGKKRQENIEKLSKLKLNRIGLDSDTLNVLMQNRR